MNSPACLGALLRFAVSILKPCSSLLIQKSMIFALVRREARALVVAHTFNLKLAAVALAVLALAGGGVASGAGSYKGAIESENTTYKLVEINAIAPYMRDAVRPMQASIAKPTAPSARLMPGDTLSVLITGNAPEGSALFSPLSTGGTQLKTPGCCSTLQGPVTLLDAVNQADGPVMAPHLVNITFRTGSQMQQFKQHNLCDQRSHLRVAKSYIANRTDNGSGSSAGNHPITKSPFLLKSESGLRHQH